MTDNGGYEVQTVNIFVAHFVPMPDGHVQRPHNATATLISVMIEYEFDLLMLIYTQPAVDCLDVDFG